MLRDPGKAKDAAGPTAPGDAGGRTVVAEQGVGIQPHREDPRGGELAVENKAEVTDSAEGKRRESGGNDVGLNTGSHRSEEPEAFELANAGAENPLVLPLDDVEGELEVGRGGGRR